TSLCPISAVNKSKEIWVADACEFTYVTECPVQYDSQNIPGVSVNLMNFLGGPRVCVESLPVCDCRMGSYFALARSFEFELAVAAQDIVKTTSAVQRPLVQSGMVLKPYQCDYQV
ncbi:hypothetical protein WOLCODRAFT_82322, partial [Wolfiporia cocos MD-104 SS10]